jgi:hypothetical protein
VQYKSRPVRLRVDLAPLAVRLSDLDAVRWRADDVDALTPQLRHDGESSLPADTVTAAVREHLLTSPPAWDPAVGRRARV